MNYRDKVRELLKSFGEFVINSIPRNQNFVADLLANVASKLIPTAEMPTSAFSIQLLFRPSVPDNITNFRVFDDDEQIIIFLASKDVFKDAAIDDQEHDEQLREKGTHENSEDQSKGNCMPKSIVRLGNLFDFQDGFKKPTNCKAHMSSTKYEVINLGTESNPQNINLGKCCTLSE